MPTPKSFVEDAPNSFVPDETPESKSAPETSPAPKKFVPRIPSYSQMEAAWMEHMKEHLKHDFQENAPAVLGLTGSLAGLWGGPPGAILGAAYGGYVGTGIKRDAEGKPYSTGAEVLGGVKQGLYELGGQVGGRVLGRLARPVIEKYPELFKVLGLTEDTAKANPKAVGHLTAAASTKASAGPAREAIAGTIGDIEQEMVKLPPEQRTVDGFLGAVNSRKSAMNEESGQAMFLIQHNKTIPKGVMDRLDHLKTLIPMRNKTTAMTEEGAEELAAINRAQLEFRDPWTYHNLDLERVKTRARMDKFHSMASVPQYTALKANRTLAIDDAIEKGLKDTIYPEMDRAMGKPEGYYANLKGRQSSLIDLEKILEKRVSDLSGAQSISEVTPRISTENISISAHPTSMPSGFIHGVSKAINPPRELAQAGKHVAKAFPSKGAVNSLPYQFLFANALRMRGPLSQQLQAMRSQPSQ